MAFGDLHELKKPNDPELLERLQAKLGEYRERLGGEIRHPKLAIIASPSYRTTIYKIDILTKVLNLGDSDTIKSKELIEEAFGKHGDHFDAAEYFNACSAIAHYIGIPFPGAQITKELPLAKAEAVAA
jgi:hypothetical protein